MRRFWYRRILIIICVASIIAGTGYGVYEVRRNQENIAAQSPNISEELVIPGGMPVGIYMETDGVMVLGTEKLTGTDGISHDPAAYAVYAGDYITAINQVPVESKQELVKEVDALDGENVILHVHRNQQEIDVNVSPVEVEDHSYKLGIWVRDNTQGLGTMTFLTSDSRFGGLGHGIHDTDTGELLNISGGTLYKTGIRSIQRGEDGNPGSMEGIIVYNDYNVLGTINTNCDEGIYGKVDKVEDLFPDQTPVEVADKSEIQTGEAVIRCGVEGTVKEYQARITDVNVQNSEPTKGITLEITDENLLRVTGGIVQGMSGSPILQKGKLIGAVTHVIVNNSSKGYGIFIGEMMKNL